MAPDLPKKLVRLASYVFTAIFLGAVFAQRWLENAYWLPPATLLIVVVLGLLALLMTEKFKSLTQILIERLPILASFFIVVISAVVVCCVLVFGLNWGLKISKKSFPNSRPNETHGTSDSVTAVVQHPEQSPEGGKEPSERPTAQPTHLSAQCSLPKDFSPCEIRCSVYNPHDTPNSDVSVGFNGIFPYQTQLAAGTETHMSIKKQETLPLPMAGGYIDQDLKAFSVEMPLIPPKTTLSFTLWSRSDDNQKACAYLKTTIRSEQRKKINQLVIMKPNLNADMMESLQTKNASLFVPGYFMSAEGRRKVEFVTKQEEKNAREFSGLYEKVGRTLGGKRCLIPVFAAERSDGGPQYFANAPPMMTWVFNQESMKMTTLPGGAWKMETDPHPPANYVCEDK